MPDQDPDGPSGPPPHPLDRPWVHPSEIPPARPRRPARHRAREVLPLALAGVAGAVATLVVLAATGALSGAGGGGAGRAVPVGRMTALGVTETARSSGASVVAVVIGSALGSRRASGVHLRDGHVVTNATALAGASLIQVVTGDGATHDAEVVGSDPLSDLALLRVDVLPPRPATLAAPGTVRVGDPVVAVAGGDGSHRWMAAGVVASQGGWVRDGNGRTRAGLMTTDRPLPPGAAGGPLLDRQGRVVGILCGGTEDGTAAIAVPADWARTVIQQLQTRGRVEPGYLGVRVIEARGEVRVTAVDPGSPAARAGLRPGDRVLIVAGTPVRSAATLVYEVQHRPPGSRMELRVERRGRRLRLQTSVTAPPAAAPEPTVSPVVAVGTTAAAVGRDHGGR